MESVILFPQDKNYILKEAQESTRESLLNKLVLSARDTYLTTSNPLGLEDDTVKTLKDLNHQGHIRKLLPFYQELAGVYRYKIGSNQLEFIFSGKSHYEKYLDDWTEAFEIWCEEFLGSPYFIRAVLEIAILHPLHRKADLAVNRLKVYLSDYFQLKVYKYRGIQPMTAA